MSINDPTPIDADGLIKLYNKYKPLHEKSLNEQLTDEEIHRMTDISNKIGKALEDKIIKLPNGKYLYCGIDESWCYELMELEELV